MYIASATCQHEEDAKDIWIENFIVWILFTSILASLLTPLAVHVLGCEIVENSLELLFVDSLKTWDALIESTFSPLSDYMGWNASTKVIPKLVGRAIIITFVGPIVHGTDLGLHLAKIILPNVCITCPKTMAFPCTHTKLLYTEYLWYLMPLGFERPSRGLQGQSAANITM